MRATRNQRLDQPRAIREPSQRNLAIYDEVTVHQRVQSEVARQYGLSQRRVSQICQQVEKWRERTAAAFGTGHSRTQRLRMERLLLRRRYEHLYAMALEGLLQERKGLVTKKTITAGGQTTSEVTQRAIAHNPRWLEIAQLASSHLHRLDEGEPEWNERVTQSLVHEMDEALAQLMGQIRPAVAQMANAEQQAVGADSLPEDSPELAPATKSSSSTCAGAINAGFSPLHLFPVRAQHTVASPLGATLQHEALLPGAENPLGHKLF
jgi:hypothetical protein